MGTIGNHLKTWVKSATSTVLPTVALPAAIQGVIASEIVRAIGEACASLELQLSEQKDDWDALAEENEKNERIIFQTENVLEQMKENLHQKAGVIDRFEQELTSVKAELEQERAHRQKGSLALAKTEQRLESAASVTLENAQLRMDLSAVRLSESNALREVAVLGERLVASEKCTVDACASEQSAMRSLSETKAELAKLREVAQNSLTSRHEAETRAMVASAELAAFRAALASRPLKKLIGRNANTAIREVVPTL
jgi:lipid II:glycine glycyltransferase (peptidoglycan interpeptide bridge formation enzyme)